MAAPGDWTQTGTATAGTYSWARPANWDTGTVVTGGSGATFNLNAAYLAANTFRLDGDRTMETLTISPNVTFGSTIAGNFTGGAIVFKSGTGAALNFTSANAAPGINNIYAPIRLDSNLEVSSAIAGAQGLRGSITGTGSLTFDSNGNHGAGVTNTLGDFAMTGVNSYSGGTTITEARVAAGSSRAFGTGAVTVGNGGQIYANGGGQFRNNISLAGQGWNETAGLLGAIRMDGATVFNGTTTLASSAAPFVRLNSHAAATGIFNGQITGGANVEFTNTAAITNTFVLNNSTNNWSGTTRVGRGTAAAGTTNLQVGNFNTSGVLGTGDITLDAGGVLQIARSNNLTIANNFAAGAGNIVNAGLGTTTLTSGSILNTGGWGATGLFSRLIINPGGSGGALASGVQSGTATLSNYADVEINTSSNVTMNGSVNAARGAYLIQNGAGTLTLGGAGDNSSGRVMVNAGTVVLAKTSSASVHAIGAPYNDMGAVVNGGILQLGGTGGDQIFDQTAVRVAGGTFDLAGQSEVMGTLLGDAGASVLNSTTATTSTLTFTGNSNVLGHFDNSFTGASTSRLPDFAGVISDGTGQVSIARGLTGTAVAGGGLQILSGANTYSGATNIHTGTLSVTGSTLSSGAVNVNASATGAGTLAGTGSVGNITVALASGANVPVISPGATGLENDAAATLTATTLTMNGGNLKVNAGFAANDLIAVTGAATFTGGTITPVFTSAPGVAPITFLTSGVLSGAPTLAGVPAGTRGVFGVAAAGNNLTLTNTVASQSLTWSGTTNGNWDLTTLGNWGNPADTYFNLDEVTFGGAAPGTITLAAGLHPSNITVSAGAGSDYTWAGGSITGNAGITKSNAGNLTINTANSFTGDVRITGGMVTAGNGAALGSANGQTYVSGGGTLNVNGQNLGSEIVNIAGTGVGGLGALVNNGAEQQNALKYVRLTADATVGGTARFDIRGPGSSAATELLDLAGFTLTKTGTGSFVITQGTNVTNGNIAVNQGTFSIETNSIVQGTGTITYTGSATGTTAAFYQTPNGNVTRPIVLDGTSGSLAVDNFAQNNTVNSPVTASGRITLQGGGSTHIFGGAFSEGSSASLTKTGGSAYVFAGDVAYTGTTTVNQGTLTLGGFNTASSSAVNTVSAGGAATLGTVPSTFNGGTQGNLNFGGGGYTTISAAPSSITINNGTLGISTRVSQNFSSAIANSFNGGTNTISVVGAEQDTTIGLTGAAIGNSTHYGVLAIGGGTVNVGSGSALNLRSISMTAQAANTAGANMATLNIAGGDHQVAAVYLGDGTNSSSILNMSGGTLTFVQNGNASLQSTNNSGAAVGGVSGLRIGHFGNGASPGSIVNLSGGTIDASKATVSVGWDGAAFLNVTGGTLKARTLIVDNNGASALPIINRVDLSGGGRIEIGHGGMPTQGGTSAINSGTGTWAAVESSDWTRGMSLTDGGSTTFDTGTNRVLMTGQLAGAGSLTKEGTGLLVLGAPQVGAALTTTAGGAAVTNGAGTLLPGMLIINANVPAGAYIASVNSATTFTLNSGAGVLLGNAIAATEILPNIQTGAVTVNEGTVRLNNMLAMGDSSAFDFAAASTLDVSGFNNTALAPAIAIRPTNITLGGAGQAGMLGGLINSSGNTGGIAADSGGTISMPADTTVYAVGRIELGGNLSGATWNNTISGGANTLTKNGQGQLIWRGAAASSIGDIVVNGGHFYAEENDNNLGSTGSITANRGGMISAWQAAAQGSDTLQSKPVVLNGGGILADVTSTWSGGLTLTADSQIQRNSTNAAVLNFTGTSLDLGGYTLTRRDRGNAGANASAVTFSNNTSSGSGSLDIHAGNVSIGANSTFDGAGNLIVRTDGLLSIDATATVSKTIQLYGGSVTDAAVSRNLTVNSAGSGYLRASNAAGTLSLGTLNLLGTAGTASSARTAGMMFGSGNGYTANGTAGTAVGGISLSNSSILLNNPNFTVSSNPGLTAANDTTFAMWDGSKVTGVAPTQATLAASGATDYAMVVAAETVAADQTIKNLTTDAAITVSAGATLKLASGGVILREAATAGWSGNITSGRSDGILGLTLANRYAGSNGLGGGDVGSFAVGNITNNVISAAPLAFRPVALVVNGFGNSQSSAQQQYTSGTYMNGGRFEPQTPNAIGLGSAWVREGGSLLFNGNYGVSNNMSLKGLGVNEAGGTFGALRLGGGAGAAAATGTLRLDSAITRIHGGDNASILGNVTGSNILQRTGGGTIVVRSALGYTGATHLGIDGAGTPMGTHTVFNLANGGVASGLGASSSAASSLVWQGGTLNYIGGGASTDRLFTVAPTMTNGGNAITLANNGYGNLAFTNAGAIVMANGSTDATLTLTANNYTANTFTPSLSNPAGARLGLNVNGPGSWTLNGSSYDIGGSVALSGGADLILNTAANVTLPVLTGGGRSYLVKEGTSTLTLGGAGLLADGDNASGQIIVNAGTVVFDKRGANGYAGGAIVGAGTSGRVSALGANGSNAGDGLVLNGGTVRYATTANLDQIFDSVDVRINGGTLDFNGRDDAFDSLNGTGGTITNGLAGTISQVGIGNATSVPSALNFRALASYGGTIADGAGQIELIKIGNGVQELIGTNTYTGRTSIAAGLLRISSEANLGANPSSFNLSQLILAGGGLETSANVTIDDSNRGVWLEKASPMRPDAGTSLTFATPVSGPGNLDVVGQGTVTLAAANLYTGPTSLYRGSLVLDYVASDTSKLADGSALVLRGGNLVMNGGTHVENVSATTVDGGGVNTGASYISNSGGRTAAINLNAIGRTIGNGGTLDLGANGTATTDSTNTNGILASAGAGGFTGTAYATVGKSNWAFNSTNAGDGAINGFTGYTATGHHDAAAGASAPGTVSTLRLNAVAGSAITGSTVLTQQGILMTPAAGASSIAGTLTGFGAQTAAISSDIAIHQHSANDLTISAVIANTTAATFVNTTALTKSGAGKLILTGANTYTGITYVNEGTLELQGAGTPGSGAGAVWLDGTLNLNRSGAYTLSNGFGGAATGLIVKKDNSAVATLTGGIGTYAGSAVISQGALVTTGDAFSNANATNELAANNTVYGTITLGDAGTGATDNVIYSDGRTTAHTIRKDIVVANTGSSGLAIIGSGTVTDAATGTGASKTVATIHQGTVQLNRSTILRANTSDRLTFQGAISGNVGTLTIDAPNIAAVAINTNPGRVSLEATNTFVGDVVVNGAILQVGTGNIGDAQDQIPDASNVTLNGVSAAKQAGLQLNGDSETINNFNGDANTFLHSIAAGNATMSRLTVNGTGTFSGVFNGSNGGGMTLEKAGSGKFTLAGAADNNTGRVLVTSGTLELAKTGTGSGVRAVGTDSVIQGGTLLLGGTGGDQIVDSASLTMYGGTFDLGGTNETVASIFSNTGVGTVTNSGAAASTLTLGGNNASSLMGAVIKDGTSAVALSKTGNGGAVITGENLYTGVTNITGGYVQVGNGGTSGSISTTSSVTTALNTQLVFNHSDADAGPGVSVHSFAPVISGAGGLVQNGTDILEIPAGTVDTYTGPTVVNSGELKVNGDISSSALTLNPGSRLTGAGTVGAIGSRGGIIAPGNSPGILTTGSVIADIDTSFEFEVNGLTAGSGHDQIQTTGIVDITDSTLVVSLTLTPSFGDKVFLWLNDGTDAITGNFMWSGSPLVEGASLNSWVISYNDDSVSNPTGFSTNAGNDISLTYVPEPGTGVLILLAGSGFLRRRRRA